MIEIPTRLGPEDNHKAVYGQVEVWLNGELSDDRWIEVDTVEGYGIRLSRNPDGSYVVRGDDVVTDRVEGKFEFRLRNDG